MRKRILLLLVLALAFLVLYSILSRQKPGPPGSSPPGMQIPTTAHLEDRAEAQSAASGVVRQFEKKRGEANPFRMQGHVKSEDGEPIEGARLSFRLVRAANPTLHEDFGAVTDANGRYEIARASAAYLVVVRIDSPGFLELTDQFNTALGDVMERDYILRRPRAQLTITVFDQEGKPVAGVHARVSSRVAVSSRRLQSIAQGVSSQRGIVHLEDLPVDRVFVSLDRPGYLPVSTEETLEAGENVRDFRLDGTKLISFLIKDTEGRLIKSPATLDLDTESWKFAQQYQNLRDNEPGKVTLSVRPNAPIFNCRISVYHYAARSIEIDPRNPPDEVVLELAPILRGTVVSETGEALAYASVKATCFQVMGAGLGSRIITDEHGRFEVELQITPGKNAFGLIRASYHDYIPKAVQITDEALRSELMIVMKRADGGARGAVIDSAGRPVKNYSLRFFSRSPAEFFTPRHRLSLEEQLLFQLALVQEHQVNDPQGTFSDLELPAGRLYLWITAPKLKSALIAVEVPRGGVAEGIVVRLEHESDRESDYL